jgi:tetratricopeptide (TPR) repeat protein
LEIDLTIERIRRLASAGPSSAEWPSTAILLIELLHAGQPELPENEHAACCEESLPVAAMLLGQDLSPDDRAMVSDFSACVLLDRFMRDGNHDDLAAVLRIRRAEASRADSAWGCEARINLAGALLVSFEQTGIGAHLEEAGEALDLALELASTAEQRASALGAVGNMRSQRYDFYRDPSDLRLAIEVYGIAAELRVPVVSARAQASLASALLDRFRTETGADSDLEAAERHIRAALSDPSIVAPSRWQALLVRILRDRYQQDGNEARLGAAWELISMLVHAEPPGSPERASLVSTAASVAFCRYLARHDRPVLDEAIRLTDDALDEQGLNDGAGGELDVQDRAVLGNEICLLRTERFNLDGVREDIDRAVDAGRRSVAQGLPLGMELGLRTNLANALHRRFESYEDPSDLHEGIRLIRWVSRRSPSAAERATALHSLAVLLGDKAWVSGRREDFDEAIACADEVIALTPSLSTELAGVIVNKADLIKGRETGTGGRSGLGVTGPVGDDRVLGVLIGLLEEARSASAAGSSVRALAGYQLGCHYAERSGLYALTAAAGEVAGTKTLTKGEADDLRRAMELWREAIALDEPFIVIEVAQLLGNAAFALEQWGAAAASYRAALGAADVLVGRRTQLADQHLARFRVQGVAAAAALSALSARAPRDAVLCLERGTATVLARACGRRPDEVQFDDVVAAAQSVGGPLVYWAATLAGGCAIVVRPDGRVAAEPVALTSEAVESRLAALRSAFGHQGGQSTLSTWATAVQQLLAWVWETAIAPVIGELDGFPAVGLIPVGRLASLPLAASGLRGSRPLLERTVPRLLPNSAAVRAAAPWPASPRVAVLCDPGRGPRRLPHADVEADLVAGCHPRVRRLAVTGEADPTARAATRRVLRARGTASEPGQGARTTGGTRQLLDIAAGADLAHVICHYDLDSEQPLNSVLRIGGGVTVADLINRRLPGSPHLVLSACDTGLGGVRLPDEAVGLGMVLLAAGARSVMASLWPLDDELAAEFMGAYHRRLAAGEEPASALASTQRDAARGQEAVVWPGLVHVG